jgi:Cation/multidrug efflux pump
VTAGIHSLKQGQQVRIEQDHAMKSFNLSDWALGHRSLVWYFMIAFMAAGSSHTCSWGGRKILISPSRPW